MKTKTILYAAMAFGGFLLSACEGESKSCIDDHIENGLSEKDAQSKCDEELVETVVVLDELK